MNNDFKTRQIEKETSQSNREKASLRLLAACSMGTILEWYDFSLYAYLAPILSQLFFPHKNQVTAIILTYSVFAIGFLARPIGAIIFGHFGDRISRKKVLMGSIILMAGATSLIGIIPTYDQIGLAAPGLLVILRILQGFSIGGEVSGAGSFVIESMQNERRGFATSLIWASSGVGMLCSSIGVAVLTQCLTHDQLSGWGWRLLYLLGAVTGVFGYYLRKNTIESVSFRLVQASSKIARFPLIEAMKKFNKEIIITISLYILSAILTYLVFVYMPIYAATVIGLPSSKAITVNTFAMAGVVLLVPVVGYYSDIVGRKIVLVASSVAVLLLSVPLYILINRGSLFDLIIAQTTFVILTAGFQGSITSAVLEMFPTHVRYSAVAFGYNLSFSLFGGTAPLIAVYLISTLKNNVSPSLYLCCGALLALIAACRMRETYKAQLL